MNASVHTVAIAGGSCSGKTTLALALARELGPDATVVLELDCYYRDQRGVDEHDIEVDIPDAIDSELLLAHLRELKRGRPVRAPVYDFSTHIRTGATTLLRPAPHLVVEGLFALHWPGVRDLVDTAVFIDSDAEACLRRRIERDTRERGRSADEVRRQFARKVIPNFRRFVLPTRAHADAILAADEPVDEMLKRIRVAMAR